MLRSLWREVLADMSLKLQAFWYVSAVSLGFKDGSFFNSSVTQPQNCRPWRSGHHSTWKQQSYLYRNIPEKLNLQSMMMFKWTDIQTRYILLTVNCVNLWELFCICNADVLYFGLSQHPQGKQWGSKQLIHALGCFLSNSCTAVQLQSNTSDRCIHRTWRWRQILWNFVL
jgi:hypothetical protein